MNFVSLHYAVFLITTLVIYWNISHRWQRMLLLAASYLFYGFWDWRFLALIFGVSCIDFIAGNRIYQAHENQDAKKAKYWLWFSLACNLSLLGYFKYANFFIESFKDALTSLGIDIQTGSLSIILPVGISFYVFQSISHSIDVYRRTLQPSKSFVEFLTFVSFFPQLVAGPIVRAREFLFQLATPRRFQWRYIEDGVHRIITGVIKKAVIADNLAILVVDPVFSSPGEYSTSMLWVAVVAYSVQIYCDFSGYSNIAIGSAKLFGFDLPENFKFPYLARNFSDFWERWHLTMSRFFRDYVYIPLGGNRRSPARNTANLVATTMVSGLWHGAAWNFVIWGMMHGALLIIQRMVPKPIARHAPAILGYLAVYLSVLITWVFFRSADFSVALEYVTHLFVPQDGRFLDLSALVYFCFLLFIVDHVYGGFKSSFDAVLELAYAKPILWGVCCFIIFHCLPSNPNPFIYFQF